MSVILLVYFSPAVGGSSIAPIELRGECAVVWRAVNVVFMLRRHPVTKPTPPKSVLFCGPEVHHSMSGGALAKAPIAVLVSSGASPRSRTYGRTLTH